MPGLKTDSIIPYDLSAASGDRDYIMQGSAAKSQIMVAADFKFMEYIDEEQG